MHHVDADIRLARRIRRDTVERGRDVASVLEQVFKTLYLIVSPFSLKKKLMLFAYITNLHTIMLETSVQYGTLIRFSVQIISMGGL